MKKSVSGLPTSRSRRTRVDTMVSSVDQHAAPGTLGDQRTDLGGSLEGGSGDLDTRAEWAVMRSSLKKVPA